MASSSSDQAIINTQIEGYAKQARDAAASALERLGTANSYVERAHGNLIAAQSSYSSAYTSLNQAKTAYNRLADADISLVLGYKNNAIIADISASQYKLTAYDNKMSCIYYADLVSGQVSRMVTDISYARLSANDASSNAASAVAASTSSEAWGFYTDASSSYILAKYYYIDTSNAHSLADIYYTDASSAAAASGRAYSGALVSFSDVSNAYNSANSIYNADKFTNIALTLKGNVDIIYNKKISAALDVSYTLGYYLDASFQALTALTAYNNSAGYVTSALIYANDASGSTARAYSAYTRLSSSDVITVSGYTVLAGQADISASYYRNLAYYADLSAIQFAVSVSGQVLIMRNDVSYSLGYANDASTNAVRAINAVTSADASGYYHIAYSDYQFAYGYYTSDVSAHSSASIYCNNTSYSATAAGNAYSSTVTSYNDISDAYGRANTICVNNTDTTKSSTLNEYLSIIGTHRTHAAQDVSYALGYYLDASNQNITALTAYNNSDGYVASTLQHANDASGSSIAAYNAYTRLLSSEQPVVVGAAADFYTPAPFTSILAQTYTAPSSLTLATTLTTRKRYILACSGGYLSIDSSFNLVVTSSLATYKDVMCKILEMDVSGSTTISGVMYSYIRIDSDLDYLYSLDCSGTSAELKFSNNWGAGANTTCGYVQFAYNLTSKLLIAGIRQRISDSSYNHSVDTTFNTTTTPFYVTYNTSSGRFTLTSNSLSATPFTFYNSPINCDMPTDFNPYQIPYVPNTRVSISSYVVGPKVKNTLRKMDSSIKTSNMKPAYLGQIDVSGSNWRTDLCGNAMLDSIYANVHSQGNHLRYDLSVYKSFRSGALNTTLGCNSIADGTLGQNTVPYVYYTLESDSSGKSHPFMVIASYSISDKPNRLLDVCRPPADGTSTYANDSVTRDVTLQNYLMKIPMLDYGKVETLTENTMRSSLLSEYIPGAGDPAFTTPSPYNYASTSAIGIAVDGVVIYPVVNNTLHPAQSQAEITNTGIHIGQGMGLHYHADGQGATSNNMNLYNSKDYVDRRHPPLIGFGLDGIALYGQYDVSYSNMHGNTTPLDQYGGHDHGTSPNAYGYHYHAHTVNSSDLSGVVNNSSGVTGTLANPTSYKARVLMKGAWAGKINTIPEFWDISHNTPSYTIGTNNSYYVGISGGNSSLPPPP